MTYCCMSIRMLKVWNPDHIKCSPGYGASGTPVHCWWECKMVQPLWKQFLDSLQNNHALTIQSNNHTSWHLPREAEINAFFLNIYFYLNNVYLYTFVYNIKSYINIIYYTLAKDIILLDRKETAYSVKTVKDKSAFYSYYYLTLYKS